MQPLPCLLLPISSRHFCCTCPCLQLCPTPSHLTTTSPLYPRPLCPCPTRHHHATFPSTCIPIAQPHSTLAGSPHSSLFAWHYINTHVDAHTLTLHFSLNESSFSLSVKFCMGRISLFLSLNLFIQYSACPFIPLSLSVLHSVHRHY